MVNVAQLVRAPDCGSGGRRFESGLSPFTPNCFLTITIGFFILQLKSIYSGLNKFSNFESAKLNKSNVI